MRAPATTASTTGAPTYPAADPDRRFYAFAVDRLVGWSLVAVLVLLVHRSLLSRGEVRTGVLAILGAFLLVGAGFAVLLGLRGTSPGKTLGGLRVVDQETGDPIGVLAALERTLILGVATLPTFGIGTASLAWTAVMDGSGFRRGWHDHRTGSVVVDVRPAAVEEERPADAEPRAIVNLTAMRLVPARPAPSGTRARHPAPPPADPVAAPARAALSHPLTPLTSPVPAAPAAPASRWRVTFDTGESFLVDGPILVGRRPEARDGEVVEHLVSLPSQDMSLSKTHAQVQLAPDEALVVLDRGSTNGSVLLRRGVTRKLAAAKPATLLDGDTVRFGDRSMTVARES